MYMFLRLVLLILIYLILKDLFVKNEPGFFVLNNILSDFGVKNVLHLWKSKKYSSIKSYFLQDKGIKDKIKKTLGPEYSLIDYTYIIEDSAIHTYHRDYTSSRIYNDLKHPSYTMILYLDDFDGLSIIPGSHKDNSWVYALNKSKKIKFKKGDAVIFDADILHSGNVTKTFKRHCIQFKIIHNDDINSLPHLMNYYVLINRPNKKSFAMKYLENSLTRHFPIVMDLFQQTIKSSFSEKKTPFQKIISSLIFSNKDFYKPIRI